VGFTGWAVYEFDRAWLGTPGDPSEVLTSSARTFFRWIGKSFEPSGTARGVLSVR